MLVGVFVAILMGLGRPPRGRIRGSADCRARRLRPDFAGGIHACAGCRRAFARETPIIRP